MAAARGGYTTVLAMPNLAPVPDCAENLAAEEEIIRRDAVIRVMPYGALTVGEKGRKIADLEAMAGRAAAFSDDGRGVQSEEMMRAAMTETARLGMVLAAHCEDESLLNGGYIHDGEYARAHGHRGIPSECEWRQIERDVRLAAETGCAYHVCHVSSKESVEIIRRAKAAGVDVTCETAPHYLILDDSMLRDDGGFRMNPPIRGREDREALINGILDGTVDMIATDHAPHSEEEKSGGLAGSLNGIVGLETAFPVLYTDLVRTGIITMEKLMELMHDAPNRRFGIGGQIAAGERADISVYDLDESYEIDPGEFLSMGRSTPFKGMRVFGRSKMTLYGGETVWEDR